MSYKGFGRAGRSRFARAACAAHYA